MANDYIPRPDAWFQTWQNNFVTYVNGHLPDLDLAAGVIGGEIWGRVAWASRRPLRPLRVSRPGKRKVEKKRGQK